MPSLFDPLHLRGVDLANRIVVSPMSQYSAEAGEVGDWHRVHYGALANSGAGLVMIEATSVDAQGKGTPACLELSGDEQERTLCELINLSKKLGQARIGLQLNHSGRKASMALPWAAHRGSLPVADGGWETVSASAIPFGDGWLEPIAASVADLERIVSAFASSAERAKRAGVDVLEVHAAHGYLLHSFLSPISNMRADRYGGSLENRMRFPLEVFAAVRSAWTGPLGVKVSSTDWSENGATIEEALAFCQALEKSGCDYVCMTSGAAAADIRVPVAHDYQVQFAEAAKKKLEIPVWAVGLIHDPVYANDIIEAGRADAVALARAFLDNPHWAYRAANTLGQAVRRPPPYAKCAPDAWPGAAGPM